MGQKSKPDIGVVDAHFGSQRGQTCCPPDRDIDKKVEEGCSGFGERNVLDIYAVGREGRRNIRG